jgi:hypothetical protein
MLSLSNARPVPPPSSIVKAGFKVIAEQLLLYRPKPEVHERPLSGILFTLAQRDVVRS